MDDVLLPAYRDSWLCLHGSRLPIMPKRLDYPRGTNELASERSRAHKTWRAPTQRHRRTNGVFLVTRPGGRLESTTSQTRHWGHQSCDAHGIYGYLEPLHTNETNLVKWNSQHTSRRRTQRNQILADVSRREVPPQIYPRR